MSADAPVSGASWPRRISGHPVATADDVTELVATWAKTLIRAAIAQRGVAHVALTGGGAGSTVTRLLAQASEIDWDRVHLWYGDERWAAVNSPERNDAVMLAAFQGLPAHLHPAPALDAQPDGANDGLDDAAARYGAAIETAVAPLDDGPFPTFDVVLLSAGPDGHVASLFPGAERPELAADGVCTAVRDSPKPPPLRISMTLETILAARSCLMMITGDKQEAYDSAERTRQERNAGNGPDGRDLSKTLLPVQRVIASAASGALFSDASARRG